MLPGRFVCWLHQLTDNVGKLLADFLEHLGYGSMALAKYGHHDHRTGDTHYPKAHGRCRRLTIRRVKEIAIGPYVFDFSAVLSGQMGDEVQSFKPIFEVAVQRGGEFDFFSAT